MIGLSKEEKLGFTMIRLIRLSSTVTSIVLILYPKSQFLGLSLYPNSLFCWAFWALLQKRLRKTHAIFCFLKTIEGGWRKFLGSATIF